MALPIPSYPYPGVMLRCAAAAAVGALLRPWRVRLYLLRDYIEPRARRLSGSVAVEPVVFTDGTGFEFACRGWLCIIEVAPLQKNRCSRANA